ncbi:NAD(P)-binding protein [Carboxydothermus pertinax]|uniref:Lipoprotein n=1 Tax=Carboxydothermus pertinax TaxID=870242 RepID=A0A1L8CXI3_9THEO|nr:NAD(P)-binding protein [Carboxydothermus pertinax]GAV23646.1 lipoprotein [Carboxydothermus pertinax]
MKVAILGGGFSGLITAYLLEQQNIDYTLFEEKRIMGKSFSYPALMLKKDYKKLPQEIKNLLERPVDINKHFYAIWHGNVGPGIENRIFSKLTPAKIKLFSKPDVFTLKTKFDLVINATGNPLNARKLGLWQDSGSMQLRTGFYTIVGKAPKSFFKTLSGNHQGFVFNLPFDQKSGVLILGVAGITAKAVPFYWDLLIVKESLNVHFIEISDWAQNFGTAKPMNYHNIFFVGSSVISSPKWYRNDYFAITSVLKALKSIL